MLFLFIGFLFGLAVMNDYWRYQAVKNGHGHYEITGYAGGVRFVWGK